MTTNDAHRVKEESAREPVLLDSLADIQMQSLSMPSRQFIRLTSEDLNVDDDSLSEFMKYVRHVVAQEHPSRAARYAGILYLALISAFEAAGMIDLDWAPALVLEVQSVDYEVKSHVNLVLTCQIHLSANSESISAQELSEVAVSTGVPTSHRRQKRTITEHGAEKAMRNLLRQIAKSPYLISRASPGEVNTARELTPDNTCTLPVAVQESHSSASSCRTMMSILAKVHGLEGNAASLSKATNREYWRLGVEYAKFCMLHQGEKICHDRKEQHRLFSLLCQTETFQPVTKTRRSRTSLQKRILRARKFVHLVNVLGENVLDVTPAVSVTNLDRIPLEQIRLLPSNMAGTSLFEAAIRGCRLDIANKNNVSAD